MLLDLARPRLHEKLQKIRIENGQSIQNLGVYVRVGRSMFFGASRVQALHGKRAGNGRGMSVGK